MPFLSIVRTIRQHDLPLFETFKAMLMAAWANKRLDDILDKARPNSSIRQ